MRTIGPTDPEAFRSQAHRLVDWMADYMATVAERPVWADVEPGEIRGRLPAHPPVDPEPFDDVLADLDEVILPGMTHWQHPGWFAYFPGNTSPPAVLGEMASAVLGAQGMLWKTGPVVTELENHVVDWMVELLGLPAHWRIDTGPGGGVIQASASDATHTALVVARHVARARGAALDDVVAYCSEQAHSSVEKGANVAGYGHVRLIGVDDEYAQRPDALRAAIEQDLADGLTPAFVASALGTTGTGALDPIEPIGEIAREYGLWHHVDAAWAGSYMICPELQHLQNGIQLADSYVVNPHKLMFAGVDCTLFYVADREPLIDAMSILPPYLRNESTDTGAVVDYRDWHVALGRRFRALKLWFVLRMFGAHGIREVFREHLRLAGELRDRVVADDRLELFAPAPLGLVCVTHAEGDRATKRMLRRLQDAPDIAVAGSELDGQTYVRLSVGQLTTGDEHVERLWSLIDEAAGPDGRG